MDLLKQLAAEFLSQYLQGRPEFDGQTIHDQAKWDAGTAKVVDGVFDLMVALKIDPKVIVPRLFKTMRGR